MGTFKVGDRTVRYTVWENGNSQYLVLDLRRDRTLEIGVPRGSKLSVKKILEKKRPWIERKYEELSRRTRVIGGKRVLYRGRARRLKILRGDWQRVRIHEDEIVINTKRGQSAREVLREWMARKSKKYATAKAKKFSRSLGAHIDFTVEVKDMRSWGRCVDKKKLVFNWQLIGLPERLAEYVVAHELVHLAEGNHSKKFERKLAAIRPHYKELREELKSYLIYS